MDKRNTGGRGEHRSDDGIWIMDMIWRAGKGR